MLGLVKTALTALSAYLQLRNKAFYYNIKHISTFYNSIDPGSDSTD